MRNEQPVRRRKTDTERQRNTVPDKKVRRNSGNWSAPAKEQKQEPQRRAQASSSAARKRKAARIRQMRRKKIIRTFLLVLLIAALLAGAGAAVFMIKKTFFRGPVQKYSASGEFSDSRIAGSEGKADGFAADLCVVSGDTLLDTVALEEDQEGLLLDIKNKQVLYSKGAYDRVYPASITKIMTALLAFQYGNMEDVVTISEENITLEEGSQVIGFQVGDKVTMDELVHGLLVYSGNDAASAIATHIGGSTEKFVDMMNSYAAQLGCTRTHFTNPHGLQDENHYTTPYDIYLMLKEALRFPEFTQITQLGSYTISYKNSDGTEVNTPLTATDHYLTGEATAPKGITVLGGKTGTTSDAGNCLALLSQNAYGDPYVSIVMGASTKELLYQQMSSLLENANAK